MAGYNGKILLHEAMAARKAKEEGVVHVFDLSGHPKVTVAYAWSSPVEGSSKRRYFAVLRLPPPINSPLDAVRAAIVQEHRRK